ncbi:hypothetical protein I547_3204 [Mycobacterium kansasii 824]|nr:hypothetical protein I547_3204 [Mycobacterium kansasii 824]
MLTRSGPLNIWTAKRAVSVMRAATRATTPSWILDLPPA